MRASLEDIFVELYGYLTVFLPPINTAYVFQIRNIRNSYFQTIPYGPLPIQANQPLSNFQGGTTPAPANGVLPGFTVAPSLIFPPPATLPQPASLSVYDRTDMWYVPATARQYQNTLFHIYHIVSPQHLRIQLEIPAGTNLSNFQDNRVILPIISPFGYTRGSIEVIQFPGIHYGYTYANDTNMSVITNAKFYYREYQIAIPDDPSIIFGVITGRIPSKKYVLPVPTISGQVQSALQSAYGFLGFKVYSITKQGEAIATYRQIIEKIPNFLLTGEAT